MSDDEKPKPTAYPAALTAALERAKARAAKAWEDLWRVEDKPGRRGFVVGTGATLVNLALGNPLVTGSAAAAAGDVISDALWAEAHAALAARDALVKQAAASYAKYFGGNSATIETLQQTEAAIRGKLQSLLGLDPATGIPQSIGGGTLKGQSYEQAVSIVEDLLKQQTAKIREAYKGFEIIAANNGNTQLIAEIEQEAARQMGRPFNPVLQDIAKKLSTPDAIEASIQERIFDTRFIMNREMVLRYGKPLPGTSAQELEQIEQSNKQALENDLDHAIAATIEARPFGPTQQQGEPRTHGYILNIGTPKHDQLKGAPLNKDRAFHDLCATLMVRYPNYDLVMADDGHNTFFNEQTLAAGRINLVPMESGLLVMMPQPKAGERDSNLAVLEDYMQELVARTKAEKREAFKAPAIIARA